jgi:serine/threonine-protein kinase HipA
MVVSNKKLEALEQQYKRAVFNIIGRNQDDHTKNIAFLMNKEGEWSLSPAFDVSYSYNPNGEWTSQHQMRINGKRDQFEMEDLIELSKKADLKKDKAIKIIENVTNVLKKWNEYAEKAGVFESFKNEIRKNLRTDLYVKKIATSEKNI